MAPTREIEVEGVTTFALTPTTSYRYVLKLQNDKLSIWMEDRTSKKQWYKGEMAKDDYVTPDNCISNASVMDYLRCYQYSLDGKLDESSGDVRRTLKMMEGGALRVVFSFKFHILRLTIVKKFKFVLDPVSMKQIDVLESKLRDQQDELERHRGELDHLREELERHRKDNSVHTPMRPPLIRPSSQRATQKRFVLGVTSETGEVSINRPN